MNVEAAKAYVKGLEKMMLYWENKVAEEGAQYGHPHYTEMLEAAAKYQGAKAVLDLMNS